jgi:hypothetical protein
MTDRPSIFVKGSGPLPLKQLKRFNNLRPNAIY